MSWSHVCKLQDVEPNLGVCAWVNERQIALFRSGERSSRSTITIRRLAPTSSRGA